MSLQNVISSTVRGPDHSGYRFWWEGWGGQRKQEKHVINVSQLQINFKRINVLTINESRCI